MKNKSAGQLVIILLLSLNLLVMFALLLIFVPRVSAATGCFPDTDGHWAESYICWLSSNGIVSGYPDGTYQPENQVTRAELAVMFNQYYDQFGTGSGGGDFYTQAEVDAMLASRDSRITALEALLDSVSLENGGKDFVFTGVNVHIRDGSGDTAGATNGTGNLIVGYNADSGNDAARSGSHNLVVGDEHSYPGYGGLVAGYQNTISGEYSTVSGGYLNSATGARSSISGGGVSTASGYASSISGGVNNAASGNYSSITGGRYNIASGKWTAILGGGGENSGDGNEAWAHYSVIAGGRNNTAGDDYGSDRTLGEASAVLSGQENSAEGDFSSVCGGETNNASGDYASVSGGSANTASGMYSSISAGVINIASGYVSSVTGGSANVASGSYASISGGYDDDLDTSYDWRAGDLVEYEP